MLFPGQNFERRTLLQDITNAEQSHDRQKGNGCIRLLRGAQFTS